MSALLDIRTVNGKPVDHFGRPFVVGATVKVTALGYGACLWMTQGEWTVVAVNKVRAVLQYEGLSVNPDFHPAVHMACLTVVAA